jgi:hypothetical protein
MPNYCNNVVEIQGPLKVVKALVDHRLDFQKIHPYHPDLDIMAGSHGGVDNPEQKALEQKEQANLEKYGHKNWYDWCVDNWGTKWNAGGEDNQDMQVTFDEDVEDTGIALFQFDTAWAPPLGVMQKLMADHPELSIECRYSEPGCGFMGVWTDGVDRCYETEQFPQSTDAFWTQHADGRLLDETFGMVESMQEYEADQETEAEQKVRELVVEKKPQNIIG